MSFNHVIELLINLFVLLLSARREGESSRLELRALAAFVLLLAQRLRQPGWPPHGRRGGRRGRVGEGRGQKGAATDGDEEAAGKKGRGQGTKERGEREGEREVQGSSEGTYTQSLSADHQINVLVYFPVLVLRLGAVADRVVSVGVWAVAAV